MMIGHYTFVYASFEGQDTAYGRGLTLQTSMRQTFPRYVSNGVGILQDPSMMQCIMLPLFSLTLLSILVSSVVGSVASCEADAKDAPGLWIFDTLTLTALA